MNMDMISSGSVMAGYMNYLAPLFIVEVVALGLFFAAYFLSMYTRVVKNDAFVERVFLAFQKVWRFIAAGLVLAFVLFFVSLYIPSDTGIVLRDTSLTLFLLTGWCGLIEALWVACTAAVKPRRTKTSGKKLGGRVKK
jgi:hypothetical protein